MPEVIEINSPEIKSQGDLYFKLPIFEGPLDLLLHLIKENKIDIYDIPILDITKQYLNYLELMKELNLEIAGEFIVMAATLIYIKSRMLLPPDEKPEEQIEDPRTELVQRLLEYQAFKDAALSLREREDVWKNVFRRTQSDEQDFENEPGMLFFEASLFDLVSAFKNLMVKAPEQIVEITRETLTISDRINYIMEKIEGKDGIKFEELFEGNLTRITLIVSFLAILEIIRLGLVKAYQEKTFGSIWIINAQRINITEGINAEPAEKI